MPDYAAVPHIAYNWMVVVYFFLGGLGAGAFLLSVAANYWKQDLKPIAKTASLVAPVAIAIGLVFLLLDLGRPFNAWRLFLSFNPTSVLSWGVWFLNAFFAISAINALLALKGQTVKAIAYLGLPFAVLVGAYTGVLLSQGPGRVLWHSALLPLLFLNGGLISGIAATLVLSAGKVGSEVLSKLGKIAGWLIVLELGMIFVEMITLLNGEAEGVHVAKELLTGSFSFLFLGVEIAVGALIPLLILFRNKANSGILALASVLVLIGIFTMRYVIVIGGQVIN